MISETHNIDCIEYMKQFPDKHFELAIVDPPYGIDAGNMTMGSGKHNFSKGKNWDKAVPDEEYFEELFRVSNQQVIWGGNYFNLPISNDWIIWDKLNPNLSFSEAELAWCSIKKNIRIFKRLSTMEDDDGKKRHPTQKPIKLYRWLLKNYAQQGDKILDTHLGSQSSRIAAYDMGFDFYGCELDKDYFEQGNKRFEQYKAQQKLF